MDRTGSRGTGELRQFRAGLIDPGADTQAWCSMSFVPIKRGQAPAVHSRDLRQAETPWSRAADERFNVLVGVLVPAMEVAEEHREAENGRQLAAASRTISSASVEATSTTSLRPVLEPQRSAAIAIKEHVAAAIARSCLSVRARASAHKRRTR